MERKLVGPLRPNVVSGRAEDEMYYVSVPALAQKVTLYIGKHDLLQAGDRVGVAVSGGLDSVALLRLFLELRRERGIVLSVVHFNHKLRGDESDADEAFVAQLARKYKLDFHCKSADVRGHARTKKLSLETAARDLRYEHFRQLLTAGALDRIATAHTLDDQAETVLLRVVRGAGTRGIAGIYPKLLVNGPEGAAIIRPLLNVTRSELEGYLGELGQSWREDTTNRDVRHTRNRVRHAVLPQIEKELNPSVRERLAEMAEIARAEEEFWEQKVAQVLPDMLKRNANSVVLKFDAFLKFPIALQRRVIRAAAESIGIKFEFRHVEEVLEVAGVEERSGGSELPGGWVVFKRNGELILERTSRVGELLPAGQMETPVLSQAGQVRSLLDCGQDTCSSGHLSADVSLPDSYEYGVKVPGCANIMQLGLRLEFMFVPAQAVAGYNPDHLLDATLLEGELRVRNWRAGDRFWPSHRRSPKKVKELLQELHVTGNERKLWPVVTASDEIVWVRGFSVPARWRFRESSDTAIFIRASSSEIGQN